MKVPVLQSISCTSGILSADDTTGMHRPEMSLEEELAEFLNGLIGNPIPSGSPGPDLALVRIKQRILQICQKHGTECLPFEVVMEGQALRVCTLKPVPEECAVGGIDIEESDERDTMIACPHCCGYGDEDEDEFGNWSCSWCCGGGVITRQLLELIEGTQNG